MSKCSWCNYNISEVHSNFSGYITFNTEGRTEYYVRFCSINCCIAHINSFEEDTINQIEKKIDYLYRNYNLRGYIAEAKNPKRLKINGGNLSYDEYREGFICPEPDSSNKRVSPKIDRINDDDYISEDENVYYQEEYEEEDMNDF